MSTGVGLKEKWGVNAPKQVGADRQSREFHKSFKTILEAINGHLQYTSAYAEAAKHAALKSNREALSSAFRSALGKIDPANPAKAQRLIDKVLVEGKALQGEVATFRTSVKTSVSQWY